MNRQQGHRRDLLTVKQLAEFTQFCAQHGWKQEEPKGPHEVLRLWQPKRIGQGREWLLVHQRDHTLGGSTHVVHVSVWGNSAIWATKFYRERKENGKAKGDESGKR